MEHSRVSVQLETKQIVVRFDEEIGPPTFLAVTDEEIITGKEVGKYESKDDCGEECPQESFPSLVGRELDQTCTAKEETKQIGHDVIADYHGDGQQEPKRCLEDVLHDEVGLCSQQEHRQVSPRKHAKLYLVVFFLESEDKEDKACYVETKATDAMVSIEEGNEDNAQGMVVRIVVVEVVSKEKISGHQQKIPVENSVKGQVVFLVFAVSNGDDFLEAFEEYSQHKETQGHRPQINDEGKGSYHDKGEDASDPPFPPSTVHFPQKYTQWSPASYVHIPNSLAA